MKKFVLLLLLLASHTFYSQKTMLTVVVRSPYCGGAKPTPEMAAGSLKFYSNQRIVIKYKKTISEGDSQWNSFIVTLNSEGIWKGKIPKKSDVKIFLEDQLLSLAALKEKYAISDSKMFALLPDNEIVQWQSQPIYEMSSTNFNKIIDIEIKEKCFSGLNPCYIYKGPKPR